MSHRDRLTAFAAQTPFEVQTEAAVVRARHVPCLLASGVVGSCTIEKSFDPATRKPDNRIGGDIHCVRVTVNREQDGRVYNADKTPIGNLIGGDGKTWSNISIRKGSPAMPLADESASDLVHRYAKQIVGAWAALNLRETDSDEMRGPFKIPNTFEARAAIGPVQDGIRDQRIAVIGLAARGKSR